MGEAPSLVIDDIQLNIPNGIRFEESKDSETAINVGPDRTYFIGAMGNETAFQIRILDNSTNEWVIPAVLGTKPKPSKGHSALLLNKDRILVVKGDSMSDDCFWFLEVNTKFVREQKMRLGTEVVAWSKGAIRDAEKPIVISGPSGVGKGTLISKLMKEFPAMFGFSVSHTTRASRNNEQDGVHYHFTQRSIMEKDIEDGKFFEYAVVHGNLYGTSIETVEAVAEQGKRCILDIDVQGARNVRATSVEAIFIFISSPSFEELDKRLRVRGTETEEQIQKRLRNAKGEHEQANSPGLFDHILVNDDLETCYEDLKKLLGLSNEVKVTQKSVSKFLHVPLRHTCSKTDGKIIINCGDTEKENSATETLELEFSSIKGGAPGRTWNLTIMPQNKSLD